MKIRPPALATVFIFSSLVFSCDNRNVQYKEEIARALPMSGKDSVILQEAPIVTEGKRPELMVCLDNIKDDGSHFIISIYRQQDLFLKRTSHHKEVDIVFESSQKCTMIDLEYGRYAVAVFNDVNSNNILGKNAIGLPTESYGFSVLKGTILKVPIYKDCQFEFTPSAARCVIDMRHTR